MSKKVPTKGAHLISLNLNIPVFSNIPNCRLAQLLTLDPPLSISSYHSLFNSTRITSDGVQVMKQCSALLLRHSQSQLPCFIAMFDDLAAHPFFPKLFACLVVRCYVVGCYRRCPPTQVLPSLFCCCDLYVCISDVHIMTSPFIIPKINERHIESRTFQIRHLHLLSRFLVHVK